MNAKYTFEDWLNDEEDFFQDYLPSLDETLNFGKTGNYPTSLLQNGEIEQVEYHKIREAQKSAYDLVINFHSEKQLKQLFNSLAQSPNKIKFLNHRKKLIESQLNSTDPEKLDAVYAGEWSALRLDPRSFKKIMERHEKGLEPLPLRGVEENYLGIFGPHPHQDIINSANISIETDKHFKLTVLFHELLAIEKELSKLDDQKIASNYRSDQASEKTTTKEIYQKYHDLYNDGQGMKQSAAYKQIENWLLNDLGLTKEEIKQNWNISLELDAFTRSARNNRP